MIALITLLLALVGPSHPADIRLQADKRTCSQLVTYKTSAKTPEGVSFYLDTQAESVDDCVDLCYSKLSFCFAARYDSATQKCEFAYKGATCRDSILAGIPPTGTESFIYCIKCQANVDEHESVVHHPAAPVTTAPIIATARPTTAAPTTPPPTPVTPPATPPPAPTFQPIIARPVFAQDFVVEQRDEVGVLQEQLQPAMAHMQHPVSLSTVLTEANHDGFDSAIDSQQEKFQKQAEAHALPRERLHVDHADGSGMLTNSFSENVQIIQHDLEKNLAAALEVDPTGEWSPLKQPHPYCAEVLLLPCSYGVGRGCQVVKQPNGCLVCSCPYKSPSRGCLGPLFLDEVKREAQLAGHEPCDHGQRQFAQPVTRWYRNFMTNDCEVMSYPWCGFSVDANVRRMPRTRAECYHFCYNDEELRLKLKELEN